MHSSTPKLTITRNNDTCAWERHDVHDEDGTYVGRMEYSNGFFRGYHVTQPRGYDEAEIVYNLPLSDNDDFDEVARTIHHGKALQAIWESMHPEPEMLTQITLKARELMVLLDLADRCLRQFLAAEDHPRRARLRELADRAAASDHVVIVLAEFEDLLANARAFSRGTSDLPSW